MGGEQDQTNVGEADASTKRFFGFRRLTSCRYGVDCSWTLPGGTRAAALLYRRLAFRCSCPGPRRGDRDSPAASAPARVLPGCVPFLMLPWQWRENDKERW